LSQRGSNTKVENGALIHPALLKESSQAFLSSL
jgi:hypothetical protein